MPWTKWKLIHTHEMNSLWDVFQSFLVVKYIFAKKIIIGFFFKGYACFCFFVFLTSIKPFRIPKH